MGLSSMVREVSIAAALFASVATAAQNETCYWPDGSTADGFVQCKDTSVGGSTFCCGVADTCTVGGYCVGVGVGQLYRGGCTDQTWTASQCPQECTTNGMDNWNNLYTCTPGYYSPNNWTCGDLGCGDGTFYLNPGSLFLPEVVAEAATATSTVTVTASPAAATSGTAPATTTTSAASSANTCPSHSGATIGVGVGLGVGLGLLAIAAVCAFFFERKKRKAAENTGTTIQGADNNQKSSDYKQQSSDFTQNGSEYNQKGSDYNQQDSREQFRGDMSPAAEPRSFHEIGNQAPGADPPLLHELGQSHH